MRMETSRMAVETRREIGWMVKIEKLFKQLEGAKDPEERRIIEDEIRVKLKDYRREFGKTATDPYYERLKVFKRGV